VAEKVFIDGEWRWPNPNYRLSGEPLPAPPPYRYLPSDEGTWRKPVFCTPEEAEVRKFERINRIREGVIS